MSSPPDPRLAALTDREREILTVIGKGWTNTEIAERLHLAESTVKTHVGRVLEDRFAGPGPGGDLRVRDGTGAAVGKRAGNAESPRAEWHGGFLQELFGGVLLSHRVPLQYHRRCKA